MTLSKILTIINIMGGMAAAYCLLLTIHHYLIGLRMAFYCFLLFATMCLLVFSQFYTIAAEVESNWKLKLIGVFLWAKTLYFTWAIRFSSLKK